MPDPFIFKTYDEQQDLQAEMGHDPADEGGRLVANPWSLLTITSKMVCFSFGIPYEQCCPGNPASINKPRGICKLCYAAGGNYQYPTVKDTMGKRRELTRDPRAFTKAMLQALENPWGHSRMSGDPKDRAFYRKHMPNEFFRVHDSGDFWSPQYALAWADICEARPDLTFWFPTRVWASPRSWISQVDGRTYTRRSMISALTDLASLDNVVLRCSMLEFDDYPRRVTGMEIPGASAPTGAIVMHELHKTVSGEKQVFGVRVPARELSKDGSWWKKAWICPAYKALSKRFNCQQAVGPDGTSPCRACWTDRKLSVVYPAH